MLMWSFKIKNYLHTFMAVGVHCAYSSMRGITPMAAVYMYVTGGIGGANQIAPADATQQF
jgi:hypothetical protein